MSDFVEFFESDKDLEARILGGIIGLGGVAFRDFDLRADDFSFPEFQLIFEKCEFLFEKQGQFDVFSLSWLIPTEARLMLFYAFELGGMHGRLVSSWVSFLYQRSSERLLQGIALELQSGGDVSDRMERAKEQFERVTRSQFVLPDLKFDMQIALNDVLNPKRVMRTCLDRLDDVIVGLRGGRLYVVGARPGVGKTLVGMQVAWELSKSRGVVFGSWEMSKSELLKRVFAQELNIEMNRIEADNISQADKDKIQDLIIKADEQLFIADDPRMTIDAFRRFILNSKKTNNIEVVFVDYLQLIPVDRSFDSVRNKVDFVTQELKRIAREFDVAVVALAQLNRGAEEDKAPQAKDFKESGQIEQEADVVVLLHRKESQFDKETNFEREANGLQKIKNLMVFDVAKNRHGAVGGFVMSVLGQYSRLGVH